MGTADQREGQTGTSGGHSKLERLKDTVECPGGVAGSRSQIDAHRERGERRVGGGRRQLKQSTQYLRRVRFTAAWF